MSDPRVCVGAIAGAFGVRGEVRLKSFCAEPGAIADYAPLSLEDGRSFDAVALTRPVKGGFAAKLGGIATKEAADALRGQRLYAPRDRLPPLPDDEYYHADLIGLSVLDTGGVMVGRITAIHDHGAGDVVEMAGLGGAPARTLPFTLAVFPTIDLDNGRVIVDLSAFDEGDGAP